MNKRKCSQCGCTRIIAVNAELFDNIKLRSMKLKTLCIPCFLRILEINITHDIPKEDFKNLWQTI